MTTAASHLFPLGPDQTEYHHISSDGVTVEKWGDRSFLSVAPEALRLLAKQALIDINHLLRPGHLAQLAKILSGGKKVSSAVIFKEVGLARPRFTAFLKANSSFLHIEGNKRSTTYSLKG